MKIVKDNAKFRTFFC